MQLCTQIARWQELCAKFGNTLCKNVLRDYVNTHSAIHSMTKTLKDPMKKKKANSVSFKCTLRHAIVLGCLSKSSKMLHAPIFKIECSVCKVYTMA